MTNNRNDNQETRANQLMRAVENARGGVTSAMGRRTASVENAVAVSRAKTPRRQIQFPKETSALRKHVADVQARQSVAPTTFRLRLPPTRTDSERPRPSAGLRRRVEQARQNTGVRNTPGADEDVRLDAQTPARTPLESAADDGATDPYPDGEQHDDEKEPTQELDE